MRLVSFSVENYRSITTARKIPISNYSLLVGANNEGKSNILHALKLGMDALINWHLSVVRTVDGRIVASRARRMTSYDWKTDYPVGRQQKHQNEKTKITLEFSLDAGEILEFKQDIKSNLNGTLPILLEFGRDDTYDVSVQKPGKGKDTLNRKSTRIADFVSRRIRFEYIPAVRTASSASRVINTLLDTELRALDDDPMLRQALDQIEALQKPVFDALAETIRSTIAGFLPTVKTVKLQTRREARQSALRRDIDIILDDGNETKLQRKGDGVQSLVALAIMRHASETTSAHKSTIIAIEEPEAHLHPSAIHELKSVIEDLSESNQIVLSSHSPIFVNANNLTNTVIVKSNRAKCAEHVSEIREALGVRFADNLHNASLVLLVEGTDDVKALSAILSARSAAVRSALANGYITFDHLSGASSLSQKASFYSAAACRILSFLDDDDAARKAVEKALAAKSVKISEVTLCAVPHLEESELEDIYDKNVYQKAFIEEFGVDPKSKPKGKGKLKWSASMERVFKEAGKPWSDNIKQSLKNWLADYAADNAMSIIKAEIAGPLDAFVASVEARIEPGA
ncbi:ATP-dependent nuclease [Rhizobium sp. 'Codium 1']|uniref:ATP-dependent nuclease n=1 Tax=Rhizobium sp. 'Codium 1' TaxID=2940484 RepID=UPI001E480E5B|nr:AAA family ATPase [Rhizobium sp. 'Codium 1']MCC8931002.1 ATP-binding protein [Rhizobium sp. 'Codium 1']